MTNAVVIDASFAAKWGVPEVFTPQALALAGRWARDNTVLIAPCLILVPGFIGLGILTYQLPNLHRSDTSSETPLCFGGRTHLSQRPQRTLRLMENRHLPDSP